MPFINPKKPISAQDIYKVTLEQQAKKERDERREEALKEQSARKHLHEQSAFVEGALKRETVRDKYAKFSESVKTRLIGYAVSEIASSAMKKVNESFGKDIFNNSNVNTMNAITYSFIHENGEGSSIMYNMMKGSPSIYIDSLGKIIKETHHDMIAAVDKDDPFSFSVDQNAMKDYETSVKDIYGHDDIVESIADRVAETLRDFIEKNTEDKAKIVTALTATKDKIDSVKDQGEGVTECYANIGRRFVADVREKKHGLFNEMVLSFSKNVVKTENAELRNEFMEGAHLNMPKVISNMASMYTFIETVNTMRLVKVDEAFIDDMLKSIAE